MIPILGRYGPYFLTGYFVALSLGVLLALAVTAVFGRRLQLPGWIDGVLVGGGFALLAGRLAFVGVNSTYFAEKPQEAWSLWQGGLNFQAALVAGLLTYLLWLRLTERRTGSYLDLIAPGLAIVVSAGWAACWLEGCAYGRETLPGILAAALPDDFGVLAVRYQTQVAGFGLSAVIAALASWRLARRAPKTATSGVLFWLTLAALLGAHAVVTLFRGDTALVWFGRRADVVVDLVLIVLSISAAAAGIARDHRRKD